MSPIRGGRKYAISRASAYMMTAVVVLHIGACVYRPELAPHSLVLVTYLCAMTGTSWGHNAANTAEAVKAAKVSVKHTEETTTTGTP